MEELLYKSINDVNNIRIETHKIKRKNTIRFIFVLALIYALNECNIKNSIQIKSLKEQLKELKSKGE